MEKQVSQQQQATQNEVRIYQSPVMKALDLRMAVDIYSISPESNGTWHIVFKYYIEDDCWAYGRVYKESYIDAWTTNDPSDYDTVFSQLDLSKLKEQCMEFIGNHSVSELEYMAYKPKHTGPVPRN